MGSPQGVCVLIFTGVLGACVGSFLNVVAYRLPRECMSLLRPRSRCPRCAAPIPWHANLPVVAWLALRGRCRACRGRISWRYPLVELLTGLLFTVTCLAVVPGTGFTWPGDHASSWVTAACACVIVASLLALSLIDLDYRILPDEITKSGILLGPLLAVAAPDLQPSPVIAGWFPEGTSLRLVAGVHGVLGAVAAMVGLWCVGWLGTKAFRKPAMGLGDVKMFGAMGGVLGFWAFLALVVAAVAGALVGGSLRLAARVRYIPFGPFLALGMWAVMLRGDEILAWYLDLMVR